MAVDAVRGVNLGGWLLTEQWITPSVYSGEADDEWNLCNVLGKKRCLSTLESHWSSFITKDDFEEMISFGLNSVRIPIGYWAVDLLDYEPYVSGQYPYLIQSVHWAQELGMTVLIDLHGVPGSQNGQDNSGLIGPILFPSNTTNTERTLNVLRNLTEEFSRAEYGGVVTSIELLNEPRLGQADFEMDDLKAFYTVGSEAVRTADQGMGVMIHDAFWGPRYWAGYDPASSSSSSSMGSASPSYLEIDTHQYYAFAPLINLPHTTILESVCNVSRMLKSTDRTRVPATIVGEWSLQTGRGPDDPVSNRGQPDQARRTWFRLLFESQLAAYSPSAEGQANLGWYYWTWKTEWEIDTWSYRRGVRDGYIPSDVSNASTLAYPILDNGCVDSSFNYTAPKKAGSAVGRAGGMRSVSQVVGIGLLTIILGFVAL